MPDDWIEEFVKQTAHTSTPEVFRRWAAVSCMAGLLERRVWLQNARGKAFPSFYTILIGPPGVGKTVPVDIVRLIWEEVEGVHLSPASVSRASLADELEGAKVMTPGLTYNALAAAINELGVFMPSYDMEFMSTLTDVWNGKSYTESKRGRGTKINIKNPTLNILAGTTPAQMSSTLPEGAWDQGFLSRCLLIYSGEITFDDVFVGEEFSIAPLVKSAKRIRRAHGAFRIEEDAKSFINRWHKGKGEPRPTHPKLAHYCTRRTEHLLRLVQIVSVSQSNDLVITLENASLALDYLVEAEAEMGSIFKTMTSGGDSSVISDAMHWLRAAYVKGGNKPVARSRLNAFLLMKTDSWRVMSIIDMMERAGYIRLDTVDKRQGYVPKGKENP